MIDRRVLLEVSTPEWVVDGICEWRVMFMGFIGVREKIDKFTRLSVSEIRGELFEEIRVGVNLEHRYEVPIELVDGSCTISDPLLVGVVLLSW